MIDVLVSISTFLSCTGPFRVEGSHRYFRFAVWPTSVPGALTCVVEEDSTSSFLRHQCEIPAPISRHIVSVLGLTVAQLERHLFGETHRPHLPSRIAFTLSQQSRLFQSDAAARRSQSQERVNLGCSMKKHKVGSVIPLPVVLQGCEIGWNCLDTSSKRCVCEVARDLQLHGGLDFGTAEILYLVRILDDSEVNEQNFDSIGGL